MGEYNKNISIDKIYFIDKNLLRWTMQKEKILNTLEEIKVISDPFRFKILVLFNEDNGALTVKQMAVKLNEVPSKVHYHVKELERIGVLEIVETKEKGGVIEKFYLPTAEVFRVEKNIGALGLEDYKKAGENIFNTMQQDFLESNRQKKAGDKGQLNYGMFHLTDEEVEQLGKLIMGFMEDKQRRQNTKPYMFGHALFRKFENMEGLGDGNKD
jgi:predicted ArsR family transcriptional regulator